MFKVILIISLGMALTSSGQPDETVGTPGPGARRKPTHYSYRDQPLYKDLISRLIPHLDKRRMEATVKKLSGFHSRYSIEQSYSGPTQAEGWLKNEINSILADYKGGPSSIRLLGDPRRNTKYVFAYYQENILVKLEGQDSSLESELIILGAHYDSIFGYAPNIIPEASAPGADDNATGVAVLLEVLRLIAKFGIKFKHSVELHWYTAEETGEGALGSLHVAEKYKAENRSVKGMLNLDSLGYHTGNSGRAIGGYVLSQLEQQHRIRNTDSKLTSFVKMLVEEYLQVEYKIRKTGDSLIYYSDHYPWYTEGYPSAFVTEYERSPHLHTSDDLISDVNFEMVNEFAKLGLAFVIELGELTEIPEVPEVTTAAAVSFVQKPEYGRLGIQIICVYAIYSSVY